MKRILAVTFMSAAFVAPVLAVESGAYVALDAQSWSLSGGPSGISNPSVGYRIGLGYDFTENWGIEVNYAQSGNGSLNGKSFKGESAQLDLVGTYPFNDMFGAYLKLGAASNKVIGDATNGWSGCGCSTSSFQYGVGARYNLNKQFGIRLEFDGLGKMTNTGSNDPSAYNGTLGIVYKF
jgi:opacity protein-like surface antigen